MVEYDLANRPMQSTLRDTSTGEVLYQTTLQYDAFNNLSSFKEKVGDAGYQTAYTYDTENRPTNVKYMDDVNKSVAYVYDTVGRVSTRTVKNTSGSTATGTYTYVPGRSGVTGSTTPLVATISQPGVSFAYEYDSRGNITKETHTPQGGTAQEITYAYDNLNQLIRVNDPTDPTADPIDPNIPGDVTDGTTWVYAYDLGGNITSKSWYAYTTGTLPENAQGIVAYSYGNANWKDQLTSYDGQTIGYDAIGNTTDDGTWTYTWRAGRQLATMVKKNTTENYEFKYNEDGLRVQKIKKDSDAAVETADYTLHGKRVTHLRKGTDNLHFFYDAQGRPAIVRFNGVDYRYVNNLQGDVVGIVDNTGVLVVEYRYDAWGNLLATTGSLKTTLGAESPFRYRGYIYDNDTGLYYLRSRYYVPRHSKFLNADALLGQGGSLVSHNLYAYCANNCIMLSDPNGKAAVAEKAMEYFAANPWVENVLSKAGNWVAGVGQSAMQYIQILDQSVITIVSETATRIDTFVDSMSRTADQVREVEEERSTTNDQGFTYIYRSASGTFKSLTPRPGKDANGLSFALTPPVGGKYVKTTIEAVNATGILTAAIDGPNHVSVRTTLPWMMRDWIESRETANEKPHPYTLLLCAILIPE